MAGPWCLVAANEWLTGAMPPLMFPAVADLGRGRVADKEMPSGATRPESPPRPQVRSRAAGQIREGRAVRCHAVAMSPSPSRHTLDGAMVRVRVLDADMTAVGTAGSEEAKASATSRIASAVGSKWHSAGCQPRSPAAQHGQRLGLPLPNVRAFVACWGAWLVCAGALLPRGTNTDGRG